MNNSTAKSTSKFIKKSKTLKDGNLDTESKLEKRDISRLVDYYRMRVDNFDKERVETLDRLEQLNLTQEEQHKLEWENKKRKDEINELQNIIGKTNEVLNKERRQNLYLQFELENRNLRNQEDRRRLMDIMKLAEPVEQQYKLYQDKRPDIKEKFSYFDGFMPDSNSLERPISSFVNSKMKINMSNIKGGCQSTVNYNINNDEHHTEDTSLRNKVKSPISIVSQETAYSQNKSKSMLKGNSLINAACNISSNNESINPKSKNTFVRENNKSNKCIKTNNSTTKLYNNINKGNNKNNLEFRIAPADEKQQIVRTIILPKEEENLLSQEILFLKKHQKQTREFYEDQLNKMEESRKLKEEETRLQLMSASERIEELIRRNQKLETLNTDITKDFLHLKYEKSEIERRLYEELELVKLQNETLSSCVKDLSNKSQIEKELTKNDFERKTRELSNVLRNQIRNYEDQNNLIKEQYKQVHNVFINKTKKLEESLKKMTNKYKLLESRRNNELEGYLTELTMIRNRIKSYEAYIHKIKMYTHGDRDKTAIIKEELDENEDGFTKGINNLKNKINKFENYMLNNVVPEKSFKGNNSQGNNENTDDQQDIQHNNNNYNNYNLDPNNETNNYDYDNYDQNYDSNNNFRSDNEMSDNKNRMEREEDDY